MPVIELFSDSDEMVVPCSNAFERYYFLYILGLELNAQPDPVPPRKLQPCVACGTMSENRWCSTSCFVAEDGPPDEYYDRFDMDDPDEEEE